MVPNLRLREDMEEMFEMNWLEYVRRDTEGSDNDTRRRAACELVRGLTDKFPAEVATPQFLRLPTPAPRMDGSGWITKVRHRRVTCHLLVHTGYQHD